MKNLVFILLALILLQNILAAEITWIQPVPKGNSLNSTAICNDFLFAIGDYGTLLRSSDNGISWTVINALNEIHYAFNDIEFFNDEIGIIVGDNSTILKSTDYGLTWDSVQIGINQDINCINIISSNEIYIGTSNGLYKTIDTGDNWQFCNISGYIKEVKFTTEQIGYLCKNNKIYKTFDSGTSWILNYTLTVEEDNYIHSLCFIDEQTGFFVAETVFDPNNMPEHFGVIYKTNNGGLTWEQKQWCFYPQISINNDENYLYTCGKIGIWGAIYKSCDNGESWIEIETGLDCTLSIIVQNNQAIAVGIDGIILKQQVDELEWSLIGQNDHSIFNNVAFINTEIGFINTHEKEIYKSTDSGNSWNKINSDTQINKTFFISENYAFAINEDIIFNTTNGGINWAILYNDSDDEYLEIFFVNSEVGFVSGFSDYEHFLLKTTDSGINWEKIIIEEAQYNRAIHFINENIGFISDDAHILKTTNGGIDWSIAYTTSNIWSLWDFDFPSSSVGYCCGHHKILKTENCGESWDELDYPFSFVTSVFFLNEEIGFFTSSGNQLAKTIDGGSSWQLIDYPTASFSTNSNSHFFDENDGIIAGSKYIFKFDSTSNNIEDVSISNICNLSNYPNPFNPSTTIEFSIKNDSNINLSIFNIKGQKIKTLVRTEFERGSHSFIWNGVDELGESVSSGVYLYKLSVNGKTKAVKKFLLLK